VEVEVTRRDIRTGIATFFGGVTFDAAAQIYRPTPLATSGLAGVRPYWPLRITDQERFETLTAGRGMGAIMGVHLPDTMERRIALGGPTSGIKRHTLSVQLAVFHLALLPSASPTQDAQTDLDDLIEAIVARIHGDRTLGGAVVEAGESPAGIRVSSAVPVNEPATRVMQDVVISFDADVYPFV
jgi:hypothetical protein